MLGVSISPLSFIGRSAGSGSFGPAHRIDPVAITLSSGTSSPFTGSLGTVADPAPVVHRSLPTNVGGLVKTGSATAASSLATTVTLSSYASSASNLSPAGASTVAATTGNASTASANSSPGYASPAASTASSGGSSTSKSSSASAVSLAASIALEEQELMDSFSTTVRGKQYAGSVVESAGEYTASVAAVTGASATASLVQAAESGLVARIDELV